MSEDRLDRLEKIVESNSRSIQALSNSMTELKQEWQKDRKGIYELLARLTHSMSDFYETQSNFYRHFDQIDERQLKMTEILDRLWTNSEKD